MEEQMARRLVAAEGKKLQQAGLVARTWGNISCRIDENHFVITPSGLDYETMTARDLVLMDITMPNMDGLEALKAIRSKDGNANVVMCSAMGQEAMVVEAVQAGIKDFIVKPFKEDRLMKTVNSILGNP